MTLLIIQHSLQDAMETKELSASLRGTQQSLMALIKHLDNQPQPLVDELLKRARAVVDAYNTIPLTNNDIGPLFLAIKGLKELVDP